MMSQSSVATQGACRLPQATQLSQTAVSLSLRRQYSASGQSFPNPIPVQVGSQTGGVANCGSRGAPVQVSALPPVDSLPPSDAPVDAPPAVVESVVEPAFVVPSSLPGPDAPLPLPVLFEPPSAVPDAGPAVPLASSVVPPPVPDVGVVEADEPAEADPVLAGMKGSLLPTEQPVARSATTHDTTERDPITR